MQLLEIDTRNIMLIILYANIAYLSTHFLYFGMSLAYNSLLEGDSLPSLCSLSEQLSMNIWATTDKQASTIFDLCISNTKSGFLITFTQNLRGKLQNINKSLYIFKKQATSWTSHFVIYEYIYNEAVYITQTPWLCV